MLHQDFEYQDWSEVTQSHSMVRFSHWGWLWGLRPLYFRVSVMSANVFAKFGNIRNHVMRRAIPEYANRSFCTWYIQYMQQREKQCTRISRNLGMTHRSGEIKERSWRMTKRRRDVSSVPRSQKWFRKPSDAALAQAAPVPEPLGKCSVYIGHEPMKLSANRFQGSCRMSQIKVVTTGMLGGHLMTNLWNKWTNKKVHSPSRPSRNAFPTYQD